MNGKTKLDPGTNQTVLHHSEDAKSQNLEAKRFVYITSSCYIHPIYISSTISNFFFPFQLHHSRRLEHDRRELPLWSARQKLIEQVKSSPSLVIIGETGSGKTTQIPQFLLEAGFANHGSIAITQPRRVAAITVAQRVAAEVGCTIGTTVGYAVRFDDCSNGDETKIKYLTDGLLLREALIDPLLRRYSVVILDEAHERSLNTDILMGLLKQVRRKRKGDFRLIIMSATLDAASFTSYFDNADAAYIQGRQHPVEVFYTNQPQESYLDAAITAAIQVHVEQPPGDVLVFLTGQEEIESAERIIKERAAALFQQQQQQQQQHHHSNLTVLPLYAALTPEAQLKVFSPAKDGGRKIILCTNIAETSITVPGVRYVIDTGFVKSRSYNARLGADCLAVVPVSQAQARQRSGRAGREAPGKAFRLYQEGAFGELTETTEPEIKRSNLASVVLQLKALGISDPLSFDFMDPPPKAALLRALELLAGLGALDRHGALTSSVGQVLARLPVDPMLGKALLASASQFECAEEMLAIVAMVSTDTMLFISPRDKKEEAAEARRQFIHPEGDHLTFLAVYRGYAGSNGNTKNNSGQNKNTFEGSIKWCKNNFLNVRALRKAVDIAHQLQQHLEALKLPIKSCGDDFTLVKRALTAGLFPHAAKRQLDGSYRVVATGQDVAIHPSSVLHGKRADCIVFNELVRTTRQYARDIVAIDAKWLPELAPAYFAKKS
jgi:ATP-dependent RNA helicase DHX8/PRP22